MDDNRESRHSYQHMNDNDSCRRREESHYSNRSRDDEKYRSRRGDRDRRRSRSRSRSPPRHRDRGRGDRDRGDDRRRRYDYDESRDRRHEDQDRYNEDRSHHREDSSQHGRSDDWRLKLTHIRDAHFNRSKQAPSAIQNQFTNDGSFLEKFKQMSGQNSNNSNVLPNSLALASSSIQFDSEISLPPLTTVTMQTQESNKPSTSTTTTTEINEDLDGVPIKKPIPVPVPVSIGRRRTAKPLKTGVVFKKSQQSEEDEASREKLDAWSKYLHEVQQYKRDNCMEEDSNRPLVK